LVFSAANRLLGFLGVSPAQLQEGDHCQSRQCQPER
jgi:hypothetical protein